MARRRSEFYKGRRKKRNYALIPSVALLLLFSVLVVLFYSTQKYAVITDNGVSVDLPLLASAEASESGEMDGGSTVTFETVDAAIQFEEADYSGVAATAGRSLSAVKAIYVPYDDVTVDKIYDYSKRLSSGNALLLELKPANGYLAWYSSSPIAYSYGLNMNTVDSKQNLQTIVDSLKEENIYLVAQISCCRDELLGAHSTEVCLRNAMGTYYYDDIGYWLDPYSPIVRNYTVQLVQELWDMGFDEVVLQDVRHPSAEAITNEDGTVTEQIYYTREMSTTPSALAGVSGFAVNVAEQLSDREDGKRLSVYLNSADAISGTDTANGQSAELFLKIFDRVYYETDKYAYTFDVENIRPYCTIGSVKNRFVPVVINYLPDNTSWVLVDKDVS